MKHCSTDKDINMPSPPPDTDRLYVTKQRLNLLRYLLRARYPLCSWNIANDTGTSHPTAYWSLRRFMAWGWVHRHEDGEDARPVGRTRYYYSLTEKGRINALQILDQADKRQMNVPRETKDMT